MTPGLWPLLGHQRSRKMFARGVREGGAGYPGQQRQRVDSIDTDLNPRGGRLGGAQKAATAAGPPMALSIGRRRWCPFVAGPEFRTIPGRTLPWLAE